MATVKTRMEANKTYSWKMVTTDGYPSSWTRTEAKTPWGARVQAAPYLRDERRAEALEAAREAAIRPGARGYSMLGWSEEN